MTSDIALSGSSPAQGIASAPSDRSLAVPLVIMAGLVDLCCFLVSMGVPFRSFWFAPAGVFAAGTVVWLIADRSWGAKLFCGTVAAGILSGWAVSTAAWRGCGSAAAMIGHPDAWAYAALGRYLWYNPRGTSGGLAAIDQYASHMSGGRFGTASLLNFISGFTHPGDAASALMPFLGLAGIALILSVVFLCRRLRFSMLTSVLAGLFVVVSGWFTDAILVANFDNIIFLAFFTTLIGFLVRASPGEPLRAFDLVAVTLLLAACFYSYPEGLAIAVVLASPLLLIYAGSIVRDSRTLIRNVLWVAASALVAAPYLGIGTAFLRHQVAFGTGAVRPGNGNFEGLLTPAFLPALFAFGEEYPKSSFSPINLVLPMIVAAILFVGCRAMWARDRRFLTVALPLAALTAWQAYLAPYSYGLFKVIFCASWWYCPLLACGIDVIAGRAWPARRSLAIGVIGACLIGVTMVERLEDFGAIVWGGTPCIRHEQQLEDLTYVTQGKPVEVNLTGDFDSIWAVYYLRDQDLVLSQPRSYLALPFIAPLLAQARGSQKSQEVAFRLVDGARPEAVWSNGAYSLVPSDTPQIVRIDNPNGLETVQDDAFVWIGTQPTRITARTPCSGSFLLQANAFYLGPSLPESNARTMVIQTGTSTSEFRFTQDSTGIPVHLAAGTHEFSIWSSSAPSVPVQANGDTRSLLLGLKGYRLVKSSCE